MVSPFVTSPASRVDPSANTGSWLGSAWGVRIESQEAEYEDQLPPQQPPSPVSRAWTEFPAQHPTQPMPEMDLPALQPTQPIAVPSAAVTGAVDPGFRHSLDLARLERLRLANQEEQLDQQIAHLERIAGSMVLRSDQGEEHDPRWRWNGRHFDERFVTETLSGYYIDKERIAVREAYLSHPHTERHPWIDWLGGRSERRMAQDRYVLEQQAWRNLSQFGEVDEDEFF